MKRFAIIILTVFAAACGGTQGPKISGEIAGEDTIKALSIPFREHGYSQINTTILDSDAALDALIEQVNNQDHWNDKAGFVDTLSTAAINFNQFNLLLFPITETSGSISLSPQDPILSNQTLIIEIERTVPQVGTDDMAYYALAYQFDKDIEQFNIWVGDQIHVIDNRPGTNIVPTNCTAWHDGCNDCGRGEDGMVFCTEKACPTMNHGQIRCDTWAE